MAVKHCDRPPAVVLPLSEKEDPHVCAFFFLSFFSLSFFFPLLLFSSLSLSFFSLSLHIATIMHALRFPAKEEILYNNCNKFDSSIVFADNLEFDASISATLPRRGSTFAARLCPRSTDREFQNVHVPGDTIHSRHRVSESSHHAAQDREQPVRERFSGLRVGRVRAGRRCSGDAKSGEEGRDRKWRRFVVQLRKRYTHGANSKHIGGPRASSILRSYSSRALAVRGTPWTTWRDCAHEFHPLSSSFSSRAIIVPRATVIRIFLPSFLPLPEKNDTVKFVNHL